MIRNNMREIKFRIWDKSMMRWWCEDSQYLQMDGKKIHPAPWSTLSAELPDDDIVIEQYTGLQDKNGVEIYEGDIFEGSRNKWGAVEFKDGKFVVNLRGARLYDLCELFDDPWYRPEVIGNIHENPELLVK